MQSRILRMAALAAAAAVFVVAPAAGQTSKAKKEAQKSAAATKEVKDPVCGMMVDPATAAAKSEYKGKTYYFCNKDEKVQFDKSPDTYVKPERAKKAS